MDCCLWWQQWRKSWGVQLYAGEKSTSPWSLPRIKDYSQRKTEVISTPNRLQPQNIIILATMWYLLCCPSLHLFLTTMFKLILLLCYRHQKVKYHFCQIGNNWALTAAHCFFNQYTHQQDCFLAFIEFSKLNSMFRKSSRTIWRLCWVSTITALLSHRILHFLKGSNRSEHIMFLKKGESLFFIKLRWRQIVSRQSRSSFLQEGVENLRISAPPRL